MEEKKATGQKRKKYSSEEREKLAINFFIMRRMWQIIRKRARNGENEDTVYNTLGMSRARFTRIIDKQGVYISKEEEEKLSAVTGVSIELFQGKACFYFKDITYEELHGLIELRLKCGSTKEEKKQYTTERNLIYKKLSKENRSQKAVDEQFYRLCHFIEKGTPVEGNAIDVSVRYLIGELKKVSAKSLNQSSLLVLTDYAKQLQESYKTAKIIFDYRKIMQPKKKQPQKKQPKAEQPKTEN